MVRGGSNGGFGIWVKHGVGRPRSRPKEAHTNPAYDTREIGSHLERRGAKANIAVNPRSRLKPRRGRPYRLDEEAYKHTRGCIERFFAWLKSFRRPAIRYERLKVTLAAFIQIACILIYLRVL